MEPGTSLQGGERLPSVVRIQMGPDHSLSKVDLSRALTCSMAIYMDKVEADEFFRRTESEYPSTSFQKVHMSEDGMMLVAYTDLNDMFISFRGTKKDSLEDIGCDLRIDEKFCRGGSFHSGFFERADVLMGSKSNPLPFLLRQSPKHRIIFCGHSLGGAVSHMALLHFLEVNPPDKDQCHDSLFSIAFGAPHICDEKAAAEINKNELLRWRFINFVNHLDPVPRILHHLKSSIVALSRAELRNSSSSLKSIGGFLGKCIQGMDNGGVAKVFQVSAAAAGNVILEAAVKIFSGAIDGAINGTAIPDSEEPDFHPIGLYIFLCQESSPKGGQQMLEVCQVNACDQHQLKQLLTGIKITRENLRCHPIRSYKSVLIDAKFLDKPGLASSNSPSAILTVPDGGQVRQIVSTPAPEVNLAEWTIVDSQDQVDVYIAIKGKNLLFLREAAVNISGEKETNWITSRLSDDQLWMRHPQSCHKRTFRESSELPSAVPMVIIKTAFGTVSCPILDKNSLGKTASAGVINRMLSRIVQILIVKASAPLMIEPTDVVVKLLDGIMECLPPDTLDPLVKNGGSRKMFSKYLECVRERANVYDSVKGINVMAKAVAAFLDTSLEVKYQISDGQGILCTVGFLAALGVCIAPASVMIYTTAIYATAVGGFVILGKDSVIFKEYIDVLELAIGEMLEWTPKPEHSQLGDSVGAHEIELIKQVKNANHSFKSMVAQFDGKRLKSPVFKNATNATMASKKQFLKRFKVLEHIVSLSTIVDQERFIGVFGDEDTGKSTFIKKLVKTWGSKGASLPETGESHTEVVTPYELHGSVHGSVWMLDFPGDNGVRCYADTWKQFTALSTSAVLFLDFEFDAKRNQVELYRKMKNLLQTEVVVVFNKVDQNIEQDFSAEYFKELKVKNARLLGCREDMVYFACLNPSLSKEEFNDLQQMGVFNFKELAEKCLPSFLPKG